MRIDAAKHLLEGARFVPSPNADARPPGCRAELIVFHCISLPRGRYGGDAVERLFTNRLGEGPAPAGLARRDLRALAGARVSAHVFIRRDGGVVQFVPFDRRAWHAGESCYQGRANCNDFSIGIELEGVDDAPFEDAQYQAAARLVAALLAAYPALARARVATHADIAPGRKTDPGVFFERDRVLPRAP